MHDLLGGVCKYDMQHILFQLVSTQKILSLDSLNIRIQSFNYTSNGLKNRPLILALSDIRKHKISMSASEMLTFILIFPMLVHDIVEPDLSNEV